MANSQLVKGSGSGTREWREDFVLTGTDSVSALFSVAKATGNTTIAGSLSVAGAQIFTGNAAVSGNLSVTGTSTLTGAVTVVAAKPILGATATPASNGAGTAGMFTWDGSYLYICTAPSTWARVAVTGGY